MLEPFRKHPKVLFSYRINCKTLTEKFNKRFFTDTIAIETLHKSMFVIA